MKKQVIIIILSLCIIQCSDKIKVDCSKLKGAELISEFRVTSVNLQDERYSHYLLNEAKYSGKLIELQSRLNNDTTWINFFLLSGSTVINCVETKRIDDKIEIINYQSNYLKELTFRKIEYRIPNPENLKIGLIEFVDLNEYKKTSQDTKLTNMIKQNQEIKEIEKRLKQGMLDFIEPGTTTYTFKDVDNCMQIISEHLSLIEQTANKEEGLKMVEKTILALNELNEKCDYEIIETDQREDICEIIILAGNLKGYNSREDDITEEWREW